MKKTTHRTSFRMIRFLVFLALTAALIPVLFHSRLTNSIKNIIAIDIVGNDPLQRINKPQQQPKYNAADASSSAGGSRELKTTVSRQQHNSAVAASGSEEDGARRVVVQEAQQKMHDHREQQQQPGKDDPEGYALFYNVYMPVMHDDRYTQNALRIMQEQLAQVRDSFAVTSRPNVTTFLYYNTIGKDSVLTQQQHVQEHFCSNNSTTTKGRGGKLECIHLRHYAKGFEEITLYDVYQWCSSSQQQQDQQQRRIAVTYLHNKGSHHNRQGGSNDYWRWHMTQAVTSADCISSTTRLPTATNTGTTTPTRNAVSCQACGLLWQTIPSLHFPGNFWTARCDYIRQLLPPTADDYGQKQTSMAAVLKNLTTEQPQPVLTANLYDDDNVSSAAAAATAAEWSTGTSRYMWEQWIGSHPALQHVCDLSPTPNIDVWKEETSIMIGSNKNRLEFVLAQAPRHVLLDKHWQIKPRPNRTILTQRHARKREMHLLPGLLWKWYLLYGALPHPFDDDENDDDGTANKSSWVYVHFPDGRDWKRRVGYVLSLHENNNNHATNISSNISLMQDLFALATKEDETRTILTTTKRSVAAPAAAAAIGSTASTLSAKNTAMTKIPHGGNGDATTQNTTSWGTLVGGNHDGDNDDSVNTAVVPWVVFYNIFIPPVNDTANDEDDNAVVQNVLRIVEEQLLQIRQSYAASANATNDIYDTSSDSSHHPPLTVFYTTIGRRNILTDSVMAKLCGSRDDDENNSKTDTATTTGSSIALDCRHSGHHDEGFEDLTLQILYNFCQSNNNYNNADNGVEKNGNNNMSVIYMHSKGTFHNWPDASNERWRRHLTAAVTSQACLQPFQHKSPSPSGNTTGTCNVCGLQFYPVWTPFFPGNFFAARCNYIRELLPLNDFATNMTSILSDMTRRKRQGRFLTNLYDPKREGALGVDRYAWEHWIASHPRVRPCDVSKTADFRYWVAEDHDADYEWSMAPRHDLATAPWYRIQTGKRLKVLGDKSQRMREYFLLAGNLFKWQHLYNTSPPADSWAWDFFPDGPEWRTAVELHGLDQSIDMIADEYANKK